MKEIILQIELLIRNKLRILQFSFDSMALVDKFKQDLKLGGFIELGNVMFKAEDVQFVEVRTNDSI